MNRHDKILAAIDAIARALSESGSLTDLLTRSLDGIFGAMPDLKLRGGVFLCDPDGKVLRLAAHQGLPPEFAQREKTIRRAECLCGTAARTGETIISRGECADPRRTRAVDADDHGHFIVPMKSRGVVLGVMFLYTTGDLSPDPSDVQILDTIGVQLGQAIENFRLRAEVKQSREDHEKMRELLAMAERLSAGGQMGSGVRHEINNPLTTIIGNAELLIERCEQRDKELTARLEVILNSALRIAEITKRMREIK